MGPLAPFLVGAAATGSTAATAGILGTAGKLAVGKVLMTVGGLTAAAGEYKRGQFAKAQGEYVAQQQDAAGKADIASSQRSALEKKRMAELSASRVLALAASSGGGALDPTVVNTIAGFEEYGDYEARVALYEGKSSARKRSMAGAGARYEGLSEATAGKLRAGSTLMSTGGSLLEKYGA